MNYKRIYESVNTPEIFYHATLKRYIPNIKKFGLGGKLPKRRFWDYEGTSYENITEGVFLADDEYVAFSYLEACDELYDRYEDFDPDTDVVVFAINKSDLDESKISIDENNDSEATTWFYSGVIPFELLKRVNL